MTDAAFGSSLEADSEDDDDVADDSIYGKYVGFQNIKENIEEKCSHQTIIEKVLWKLLIFVMINKKNV